MRFRPLVPEQPQLVVSVTHRGTISELCRDRTPEELAALPAHMRSPQICERARAPVRVRVRVDGAEVHRSSHAAAGAWSDGPGIALLRLSIPAGEHDVEIAIGDTAEPEAWQHVDARRLAFDRALQRSVVFERAGGFTWE